MPFKHGYDGLVGKETSSQLKGTIVCWLEALPEGEDHCMHAKLFGFCVETCGEQLKVSLVCLIIQFLV